MASSELVGQKFGNLLVIRDSGERRDGRVVWECHCECGNTARLTGQQLKRSKGTRSCGCLQLKNSRTRGLSGTPEFWMYYTARRRARATGVPFTLMIEDIHIPDVCPVLGIPLTRGAGRQHDASPSLDRIQNDEGYTPENIVVMSLLANRVKQHATSEQVLAVADWMESLGL